MPVSFVPYVPHFYGGGQYYYACSDFAGAHNYSGYTPGLPLVAGVPVASSSAQCVLVAGVLVGVAMPLRIASMPINPLLVEL